MGYDLHITRAFRDYESKWFPIGDAEVTELVRAEADLVIPDDAPRHPGFAYLDWTVDLSERRHYLLFHDGRLSIKHPQDVFVRRMVELAERLDAWVIGDDAEVYAWDGLRVTQWNRDWQAISGRNRYIRRQGAPIDAAEWANLAAAQPDFAMLSQVEATVPSGERWIDCPPVPCWTGHPGGQPIPFFHDYDAVEVQRTDVHVLTRMRELATVLGAGTVDGNDLPV